MNDLTELPELPPAPTGAAINQKLVDVLTPGAFIEFDPQEAERAGAFADDAVDVQDAAESAPDLPDLLQPAANDERVSL